MAGSTDTSPIGVYQRHGPAWAALRAKQGLAEAPWLDRFRALLPASAPVLDIGCGSGVPIARELVRRGFAVTGLDGSGTMLELFRRNLPDSPAILGDMRRLALGQRFAGLVAWDSFFHLPPGDQRPMFARFAAHAAPGAALLFTSGDAEGGAIGELQGEALYHGSLDPDEYRTLLDAAAFEVIAHVTRDPTCGGRNVWLARQRRGHLAAVLRSAGARRMPMTDTSMNHDNRLIASNKVEGTAVYNRNGDRLGSVHSFMVDKRSGQAEYAVMSFGGFLGIGEKYHPLPWNQLNYDPDQGGYVVNLTKEQLEGGPTYEAGNEPSYDQDYGQRVTGYYGSTSNY